VLLLDLASKVGLCPSPKAVLVAVSTSPPKQQHVVGLWQLKMLKFAMHLMDYAVYMHVRQCHIHVLWTRGTTSYWSCFKRTANLSDIV
jgi:hypothetical protein